MLNDFNIPKGIYENKRNNWFYGPKFLAQIVNLLQLKKGESMLAILYIELG